MAKKTVEQIATDLNLSITTVRLVLNGKAEYYRISVKTQKKIQDYVDKYGYVINHTARSLKLNKTDTLGLVVPNLSNPFFSSLAESLELSCRQKGYQLMICCTYNDPNYEIKLTNSLQARNVDGIFIVPANKDTEAKHLSSLDKPFVFLDRNHHQATSSGVVSDNKGGGYLLTQSMVTKIKQPIVFFAGLDTLAPVKERIEGYIQAIKESGDDKQIIVCHAKNDSVSDGELMISEYIEKYNDIPQNFITSSLPILEGVISLLHQRLGYIPEHINIGAFDEHLMLNFLSNNIWSIKQNDKLIAEKALYMMEQKIANNDYQSENIIVPVELVYRLKQPIKLN